MKHAIIFAVTHFSVIVNGIEIPDKVVDAIAQVEGGVTGQANKEKNGRYSYGKYQISAAFLNDVNEYYGLTWEVDAVRNWDSSGAYICQLGLAMIMQKRKCDLRTALAVYNGGWDKRNTKACKTYATKVLRIAETKGTNE